MAWLLVSAAVSMRVRLHIVSLLPTSQSKVMSVTTYAADPGRICCAVLVMFKTFVFISQFSVFFSSFGLELPYLHMNGSGDFNGRLKLSAALKIE